MTVTVSLPSGPRDSIRGQFQAQHQEGRNVSECHPEVSLEVKDNENNISPISQLLTNIFLDIFVSNPVLNVVDAAPNVISDVVDLKGDALLKNDKATRQD